MQGNLAGWFCNACNVKEGSAATDTDSCLGEMLAWYFQSKTRNSQSQSSKDLKMRSFTWIMMSHFVHLFLPCDWLVKVWAYDENPMSVVHFPYM